MRKNILETIGNTPLIKIGGIFAKMENTNPSGSVKDRMAKYLVEMAEKKGELKRGYTIIEATSGNTGISLAMISAIKKYKFIAVMPENIGEEKRKFMKVLGGKIVLSPQKEGFAGAVEKTRELAKKYRKVWLPRQFENPDNIEAHYKGLGQEILKEVPRIDVFAAGFGTAGTLMGVAKAVKEKRPKAKIIAVEAAEKNHKIEGISDGIIPKILDFSLIDGIIKIKSEEAIAMTKKLIRKKGLLVGISSGANFLAALRLSEKYKNVVTVLPDRADRYPDLLT